jgi:hypothetical protein
MVDDQTTRRGLPSAAARFERRLGRTTMSEATSEPRADALPIVNWPGGNSCGQYTASISDPSNPLNLNSQLAINGSTNLSTCIVGPNGAAVDWITYQTNNGIINSVIYVYGQGPKGAGSGSLSLQFLTQAGQTHTLSLTSSSPGLHSDRFQDTSGIVSISWAHT